MDDKQDKKPQTFNDAISELSEAVHATITVVCTVLLKDCRTALSKLPSTDKIVARIDELLKK